MPKILDKIESKLKFELLGIILITGGILFFISLMGFNVGSLGVFLAKILKYTFGFGAIAVPLIFIIVGLRYIVLKRSIVYSVKFWGLFLLYFMVLAIVHYFIIPVGQEILPDSLVKGGGLAGGSILFSLRKLLGLHGSILVLFGLSVCAILMISAWSLVQTVLFAKEKAVDGYHAAKGVIAATIETSPHYEEDSPAKKGVFYDQEKNYPLNIAKKDAPLPEWSFPEQPPFSQSDNKDNSYKDDNIKFDLQDNQPVLKQPAVNQSLSHKEYILPPLSLLKKPGKPVSRQAKNPREVADNSRLLEQTLDSFGVGAKVIDVCQGPTITRYELEPASGVKVSRIVNLADDIALKLASSGIRIEAPIPGKAAIGIEVPNKQASGVFLSEVLESDEFKKASSPLTFALGKDIAGNPIIADLAKMPHLLVAGSTGSGKSVCINTLISSILFKAAPAEAKLILIDPKMVELINYNGIPHLLTPVVTDAKKASSALIWAVNEMERRYAVFAAAGVRDIFRYNEINNDLFLPLITIIIDELADLMMVAPNEVEDSICRLAQKARAAGIHLVLATQRPSVNVITGIIKANIPSRISFAVSSQIDSRTILDMAGAEKLLGKGDMLFYPAGASKPQRVQGAFVSDAEIEELVFYIKDQDYPPDYTDEVTNNPSNGKAAVAAANDRYQNQLEDELLEEAIIIVVETGQASVSMLQRRFRIGYTRAARLIDVMEKMAIVGPSMGSKPRDILMTLEEINSRKNK